MLACKNNLLHYMTSFNQGNSFSISGNIIIENIPENYGIILSLAFFSVNNSYDKPPYGTDPDEKYLTDILEIIDKVDLNNIQNNKTFTVPFKFLKKEGIYYLQLRAILFRKNKSEEVFAQSEQFFFSKRPLEINSNIENLNLPVSWPEIPLENLTNYGQFNPEN